jgi:signal transduction histidine kinase
MIQNARVHGQAKNIRISVRSGSENVEVLIKDDGKGFRGNSRALGRLFLRPTPTSGSGVGLYLVTRLVGLMGGKVHFESEGPGFSVRLQLREARR